MITRLRILIVWFLVQFTATGWAAASSDVETGESPNPPVNDSQWNDAPGFGLILKLQESLQTGQGWDELYRQYLAAFLGNTDMSQDIAVPNLTDDGNQQPLDAIQEFNGLRLPQGFEINGMGWDEYNQQFFANLTSDPGWAAFGQSGNTGDDNNLPPFNGDSFGFTGFDDDKNSPAYSGGYTPTYGTNTNNLSGGFGNSFDTSGFFSQFANNTGYSNTFIGSFALSDNVSGHNNTASGVEALFSNISGNYNTANGSRALEANVTGHYNSAMGGNALKSNITGHKNSAAGFRALYSNKSGSGNSANGYMALYSNTTGHYNTADGAKALFSNSKGKYNTAIGFSALLNSKTGERNTALGTQSLGKMMIGSRNLAIGMNAGLNLIKGNGNVYIANPGASTEYKTIRIGMPGHVRTFIGGIRGRATGMSDSVPVVIDSNGQLGTINSSARFKKDIKDMDEASHNFLKLRPVTYRYKQANDNGENPVEYGLIAEEVAKVYPELVAHSADGQIETVQYHKLTPMLLNELQAMYKRLEKAQDKEKALEAQLADERLKNQEQAKDLARIMQQVELLNTQSKTIASLTERLSHIESRQILGLNR